MCRVVWISPPDLAFFPFFSLFLLQFGELSGLDISSAGGSYAEVIYCSCFSGEKSVLC